MRNQPFTIGLGVSLGFIWAFGVALTPARAVEKEKSVADKTAADKTAADKTAGAERELKAPAAEKSDKTVIEGRKIVLFPGNSLADWVTSDPKAKDHWKLVGDVKLDPKDPKKLVGAGEGQGVDSAMLLETPVHGADIHTIKGYGDGLYHVEFMVPKGSNSGVYLLGKYEIQVFDSYGKKKEDLKFADVGGVYNTRAPGENAALAPGEWQTFEIEVQGPRFDDAGKKTTDARVISVTLNGKKIQQNVDVKGGTGSHLDGPEKPAGPLMLQGDHGPVAFRHIWFMPAGAMDADKAKAEKEAGGRKSE